MKFVPRGWKNIQTIGLKAGTTFTLPVYNSLPEPPTSISIASNSMEVDSTKEEKPKPKKNSRKSPMSRELPKSKPVTA
ncbi:hypothetical protein GGI05_004359 [Coemansia sp. RSA 2603]|nr:hypothetical protein GGI05_004359 [Coemansia sp. RSA 2603]